MPVCLFSSYSAQAFVPPLSKFNLSLTSITQNTPGSQTPPLTLLEHSSLFFPYHTNLFLTFFTGLFPGLQRSAWCEWAVNVIFFTVPSPESNTECRDIHLGKSENSVYWTQHIPKWNLSLQNHGPLRRWASLFPGLEAQSPLLSQDHTFLAGLSSVSTTEHLSNETCLSSATNTAQTDVEPATWR